MILLMLAAAVSATGATANPPLGAETTITFAANGGLRDWQVGKPGSGVIFVRDRTERWYRVTLTGGCATDTALDTLSYTTDSLGTFDKFSTVTVRRYPYRICGVTSIHTSAPPPGQPGAPKREG